MTKEYYNHKKELLGGAFIIVLTFVIYSPILNTALYADDFIYVWRGQHDNLTTFFKEEFVYAFRPITDLTWLVQSRIFGAEGLSYHLFNVAVFAAIGILLWWFLSKAGISKSSGFVAAVLFMVTPITPEAVTFASGRSDLIGICFMLLSLIFYLDYIKARKRGPYLLSLAMFLFALLSKEEFVILMLLIPAVELLYGGPFSRNRRKRLFDFVKAMVPFSILFISYSMTTLIFSLYGWGQTGDFFSQLALPTLKGVWHSALTTLAPLNINNISRPIIVLVGIYVFILLVISTFLVFQKNAKQFVNVRRVYLLMIIFIVVTPFFTYRQSFVVGIPNVLKYGHFLFLSNMGVIVLLALGFEVASRIRILRIPAIVVVVSLGIIFSWGLIQNNRVWKSDVDQMEVLFENIKQVLPDPQPGSNIYLADVTLDEGKLRFSSKSYNFYTHYGRGDFNVIVWPQLTTPDLGPNDSFIAIYEATHGVDILHQGKKISTSY